MKCEIKNWLQIRYNALKKHHDQVDEMYNECFRTHKGDADYYKNVRDKIKIELKFMQTLIDEV